MFLMMICNSIVIVFSCSLLVLPKQFQTRDGFFAFVALFFHSFLSVPNKLLGFVAFHSFFPNGSKEFL